MILPVFSELPEFLMMSSICFFFFSTVVLLLPSFPPFLFICGCGHDLANKQQICLHVFLLQEEDDGH